MRTIQRVYFALIWIMFLIRKHIMNFIARLTGKPVKVKVAMWCVDHAYVFPDDPVGVFTTTDVLEDAVMHLRAWDIKWSGIDFCDPGWKTAIDTMVPSTWPSWRIELVCRKKSSTRRIVCRRDETMHFPGDVANIRSTRLFPRAKVQSAVIRNHGCPTYSIDVTDILEEYVICKDRKFHPNDLMLRDVHIPPISHDHRVLTVDVRMQNGYMRRAEYTFSDRDANLVDLFTL